MIVDVGIYFLYRHIRLDTNQVFYIGVGRKRKHRSHKYQYWRLYEHSNRNEFWNNIVAKTEYETEVILETNDRDFLQEKEKEFIALYGRKDLGKGTLVNLTDGGDWVTCLSAYSRNKMTESHKRSGLFQRLGKMASERLKEHPLNYWKGKSGSEIPVSKKVYCYNPDGTYYGEFPSRIAFAKKFNISGTSAVCGSIRRGQTCGGKMVFSEYKGANIEPFMPVRRKIRREDVLSGEIIMYDTIKDAATALNTTHKVIIKSVNKGLIVAGYRFYNDIS